ncbi:MAG: amino acid permease [Candidatus Nanoarchaeia archaeon]
MAELKRVLSYPVILLIVINSIMGTGIFFLPALGAKLAGPGSILSWLLLSILGIYIASCFGELTSMFPEAGGVYEFSKQAYGRFTSFIVGWLSLITANFTIAMLMIGAVRYLLPFKATIPVIALSLLLIFVFNVTAYRGMKLSATLLVTFAFVTLAALASVLIPGLFRLSAANYQPVFPFGISAVFLAVFFIAETFFGWESPTYLAGEVRDGKRVMPRALVHGTIIISLIALVFVIVSIGAYGWQPFGGTVAPLSALAGFYYGGTIASIFPILVYLAIIGSVADWVVSAPRLILSMAKDNLFLKSFAAIHPKYGTPYKAIILQWVISSILVVIGAGSYFLLLEILLPMLLVIYCLVLLSLVVLRYKKPNLKRYFTAPFGKVGPIVVSLIFAGLLAVWAAHTEGAFMKIRLAISLTLLGVPLYLLLELFYDPKMIVRANDFFARVALWTEGFNLPKKVRGELISLLGDLKNKSVLEYGCGVGTLTMMLAEDVKPKGKVFATVISPHEMDIVKERLAKEGHKHVKVFKVEPNRIHPNIPLIDVIVSAGMIGYVSEEKKVLRSLNKKVSVGSRIVFLDYDRFFDVIPNIHWLSDDGKIKEIFDKAGFKVNVVRKQGIAWQYIYIFGRKYRNVK